ncbi:MAG: hypothetical protein AMXMBFR84_50480 [Candidatus Hydrogenedentota bacterium]
MPNKRRFHKAVTVAVAFAFIAGAGLLAVSLLHTAPVQAGTATVTISTSEVSYAPKGIERFGVTDIRASVQHEQY